MSQAQGLYSGFTDTAILEAVRTPWVDLGGALAQVSPIDLGIKVGREVLARAGIDPQAVDSVLAGSMAQASFDAWVKYYRVGENTPNATVSYYGKGALVALCLDLTLRQRGSSLDDAMRTLWARTEGGPMREADVRRVLKQLAGRNLDAELDAWVHSTAELPVESLLQATGVKVQDEPVALAQQLGLRVSETGGAVQVKTVMRGSAAEAAGLAAGDEWLGIELAPARRGQAAEAWRIAKLDEVAWLRGKRSGVTALVSRDRRLLRCPLEWPPAQQAVKLSVQDAAAVARWLAG